MIDIGSSVPLNNSSRPYFSNKISPDTVFGGQDNYAPPPYSANRTGFCAQCGAARHDLSAKYCSSCGNSF